MRYNRLLIVLITFHLICAHSILIAKDWSQPVKISVPGQNAADPQIAADFFGNTLAVWSQFNGKNLIIQSSIKNLGGYWQAPENLSALHQDASSPQIAVDIFGNVTVVWVLFDGSYSIIQSATKYLGGRWQPLADNISSLSKNASSPRLFIDLNGNVTIVWVEEDGGHSVIKSSTKLFRERWQEVSDQLSLSDHTASSPQIAGDKHGNLVVVWKDDYLDYSIIQSKTKLEGDWQQQPDNISILGQNASSPQIVIDKEGNTTVIWHSRIEGGVIQASSKTFMGAWQSMPNRLSLPGHNVFSPKLAVDSLGNVTAIWERNEGVKWWPVVQASTRSYNGSWQLSPDTLSSPSLWVCEPQIATDSLGNSIVIFQHLSTEFGYLIKVATKKNRGDWKRMQKQECVSFLNPYAQNAFAPQITIDAFGNAVVIWYQFYENNSVIETSCKMNLFSE